MKTKYGCRNVVIALAVTCWIALAGCGTTDTDADADVDADDDASTITTTTRLVSSSLFTENSSLSVPFPAALSLQQALSTDCPGGQPHCQTPDNVSGKIYYSGIMVGDQNGYSLGPIVGNVIDPSPKISFAQADLLPFDLAEQLAVSGGIVCCGGSPYPPDNEAFATRIESYFAHVDVTFTLSAEDGVDKALVGTHAIRTVYGDIDGTEMKKGDLLYKGAGDADYRWCTMDAGCVHTSRPGDPIQYESVAAFSGTPGGLGNQTIPTFSVQLADKASQIALTKDDVLANSWQFAIDFDMTNGVLFSETLTGKTELQELVRVFLLAAEPGDTDGGFTATLAAVKTPLQAASTKLPACADADLGSSLGISLYGGTNVGFENDIEPPCGGSAGGEDILFAWEAPSDGRYVIKWYGSYDPLIYVMDSCPAKAGDTPNLSDDGCGSSPQPGFATVLTDALTAGQSIIIGVDGTTNGEKGSGGTFTLDIVESVCGDGVCRTDEDFNNCKVDCS